MDYYVIAPHRNNSNNEPLDLGTIFTIDLGRLARHRAGYTIDHFIAALEATTALTSLHVRFESGYESTPENSRRVIEPLCRGIAYLRHHNPNHPLRRISIYFAQKDDRDGVDRFLVAAKQFGIYALSVLDTSLPVQSLVEFCRDNTHVKRLGFGRSSFSDEESTISVSPQDAPQNSSIILSLGALLMGDVTLENSTVETKFLNLMAHVTYPVLALGKITVGGDDNEEENKMARMRIVSALIKPSVAQLTLARDFPIENIDIIEACTTFKQIQLANIYPPIDYSPAVIQRLLQTIATRNRELARFVADPHAYGGGDLLALMSQFDSCPTGRYSLVQGFAGIPSFFKINQSADTSMARPKKRKRRY